MAKEVTLFYVEIMKEVISAVETDAAIGLRSDTVVKLNNLWIHKLMSKTLQGPNHPDYYPDDLRKYQQYKMYQDSYQYSPGYEKEQYTQDFYEDEYQDKYITGQFPHHGKPGGGYNGQFDGNSTIKVWNPSDFIKSCGGKAGGGSREDSGDEGYESLDSEETEETENPMNFMLCLYEKVTRTKNRWKCILKHGFLNINNVDYPFGTAIGDLVW